MKRQFFRLFDVALIAALVAAFLWVMCVHYFEWPAFLANGAAGVGGILAFTTTGWFMRGGLFSTLRGRELVSVRTARIRAALQREEKDPGFLWGNVLLPSHLANRHVFVVGGTGSGKTLTLKMLMKNVLPIVSTGRGHRALVYDAKQDMYGILRGIFNEVGPTAPRVVLLNPYDTRSAAWNMADDITSPETAEHLATILIPEEKGTSQPYFADSARHLLSGVLKSFIQAGRRDWTFGDVLCVMRSRGRLRQTLETCPETRHLVEQYFSRADTFQDIFSTIASKLQRYETVAAAWNHAKDTVSLNQWLNGKEEFVLVLGNDEQARTALDAVNRVIFKRIVELVLFQPDVRRGEQRRTWFFLDELREAGCLEGLGTLLTKGRSKGACVVLGFQTIEGLEEAYGERVAQEMVGQCCTKAFLKIESTRTAEWASQMISEMETMVRTTSDTQAGWPFGQRSRASGEQLTTRRAVLPAEFMDLPVASLEEGFTGYYLAPYTGPYKSCYSGKDLERFLPKDDQAIVNLQRRSADELYLRCDSDGGASGTPNAPSSGAKEGVDPGGGPSPDDGAGDGSPFEGVKRSRRGRA